MFFIWSSLHEDSCFIWWFICSTKLSRSSILSLSTVLMSALLCLLLFSLCGLSPPSGTSFAVILSSFSFFSLSDVFFSQPMQPPIFFLLSLTLCAWAEDSSLSFPSLCSFIWLLQFLQEWLITPHQIIFVFSSSFSQISRCHYWLIS